MPSILESVMSAQSNSPPVKLRPAQSFATCTASVMLFAISMPRSGAVGGGFCCEAAVISRARPAFRRTPARLRIREYTYQFRHSFVELITAADDRHGRPVGAEATLAPVAGRSRDPGPPTETSCKLRIAYRRHSRDSRACTFLSSVQPMLRPRWRGSWLLESLPQP